MLLGQQKGQSCVTRYVTDNKNTCYISSQTISLR
jgi:hypothetical protein